MLAAAFAEPVAASNSSSIATSLAATLAAATAFCADAPPAPSSAAATSCAVASHAIRARAARVGVAWLQSQRGSLHFKLAALLRAVPNDHVNVFTMCWKLQTAAITTTIATTAAIRAPCAAHFSIPMSCQSPPVRQQRRVLF